MIRLALVVGFVLGAACGGSSANAPTGPKTSLGEEDITNGLGPLAPQVSTCENGMPGQIVHVKVKIGTNGKVLEVELSPPNLDLKFIDCVQKIVASARFPEWTGNPAVVDWKYEIRRPADPADL
jgi:hypothetical protein